MLEAALEADFVQTCVVTLEPIDSDIEEQVDLVFVPQAAASPVGAVDADIENVADDLPEALIDGTVDLGAIAVEFFLLGINPYPRKPGAVFEAPPAGNDAAHPFAALATLQKKGQGGRD